MGACVVDAKANRTWKNRTTVLEGGIDDVVDYATQDSAGKMQSTWERARRENMLIARDPAERSPRRERQGARNPDAEEDGSFRGIKSVTIPTRPICARRPTSSTPTLTRRIRIRL